MQRVTNGRTRNKMNSLKPRKLLKGERLRCIECDARKDNTCESLEKHCAAKRRRRDRKSPLSSAAITRSHFLLDRAEPAKHHDSRSFSPASSMHAPHVLTHALIHGFILLQQSSIVACMLASSHSLPLPSIVRICVHLGLPIPSSPFLSSSMPPR